MYLVIKHCDVIYWMLNHARNRVSLVYFYLIYHINYWFIFRRKIRETLSLTQTRFQQFRERVYMVWRTKCCDVCSNGWTVATNCRPSIVVNFLVFSNSIKILTTLREFLPYFNFFMDISTNIDTLTDVYEKD